jgi:NAD(P)H dehydrogenase (quinone)
MPSAKAPYNTADELSDYSRIVLLAPRRHAQTGRTDRPGHRERAGLRRPLRTVPAVSTVAEATAPEVPADGAPYVERKTCRMRRHRGRLAHPLRQHGLGHEVFLGRHRQQWLSGALAGKPACVFTSTGSLHGGQESTLLSMMIPLFHHGLMVLGLPYTHPELMTTASGGTPYGASHWAGLDGKNHHRR